MEKYITQAEAIIDMNERGYTSDFQLVDNDLFWVQGKYFMRAGDFSVTEYYHFSDSSKRTRGLVVFGVIAFHHNLRGILINDYSKHSKLAAPVLLKKMNEMNHARDFQFDC
jgi:hypothetical protein